MIFTYHTNDFSHKSKIYYFDLYNVFLAIASNIPQRLKTGFVVKGNIFQNILILILYIYIYIYIYIYHTFSSEIWLNATALRNYRKEEKSQYIFCHCAANQNSLANPASNQPLLWIL